MKQDDVKNQNLQDGDLVSLNQNLYSEFTIQELEQRLETDPLLLGDMLQLLGNDAGCGAKGCTFDCDCYQICTCDLVDDVCVPESGGCPRDVGTL